MTDKKMYKVLNEFINQHTLAEHIEVNVTGHHKSFKGKAIDKAYYEDANLLSSILMGAECFLFWVRRNKIKISS